MLLERRVWDPPGSLCNEGAGSSLFGSGKEQVWLVGFCRLIPASPRLPRAPTRQKEPR